MSLLERVMTVDADFTTVCRLCLTDEQSNVHVLNVDVSKFPGGLQNFIWKYFNFWIRTDDGLPTMLCSSCIAQLKTMHTFVCLVAVTQVKIKQISEKKASRPLFDVNNTNAMLTTNDVQLGPFEPCTEPVLQVDPWHFTSEDGSSFGTTEAGAHISPKEEASSSVEIKVEVDPLSLVDGNEAKDNNSELEENNLKMRTRSRTKRNAEAVKTVSIKLPEVQSIEIKIKSPKADIDGMSNNGTSSDEAVSDSEEERTLQQKRRMERKQFWTERSKQRSKLTEQLAAFYNFTCLECEDGLKFPTYHQLNLHSKKLHGTKGYVICCHQRLQDKNVIKSHMLKHLNPGIFQCPECGKELANKESLENHLVKHLPEEERPFKCSQCSRGFPSKGGLTAHEKSHLPDEERMRYVCDVCGKRFPYQTSLNSHKKYVHLNLRTVMCHICPKTFVDKASLNSHIHTHLTDERIQCYECGKWFKNKINLRAHRKTHEGLIFSCEKCVKFFTTKHRLGEHMRGHTDARPHQCTICCKSFKVRAGLKTHMVQHTGEKPYQCPFCSRTFASSGNFSTHKKRMHGTVKSTSTNHEYDSVPPMDLNIVPTQSNSAD